MAAILYEETQPFYSGQLKVSEIHSIYYEQVGIPDGTPILFLHGGPGGSITKEDRRFFNPQKYCAILFDQRGCGQSEPFAQLQENDTFNLVEDIEQLRIHLRIDKWAVFGGSWGSTLALLYSIKYPQRVTYIIVSGIFLARRKDVRFFTQQGSNKIFPEAFEQFANFVGYKQGDQIDIADEYYQRFLDENLEVRNEAVRQWGMWESSILHFYPDMQAIEKEFEIITNDMISITLLQCHFSHNNFFFEDDNFILKNIQQIQDIPCIIIQGRYDAICGAYQAYELKQALPKSELRVISDAGHSQFDLNTMRQLVASTDKILEILQNSKNEDQIQRIIPNDYDKIANVKEVQKISQKQIDRIGRLTQKDPHAFFKRGIYFSQRNLDLCLDAFQKGDPFYLYSRRAPFSDVMHLGHLFQLMFTKYLQDSFDVPLVIQLTDDDQYFHSKTDDNLQVFENAKDIIACGFDIKKTFIYLDTEYVGNMYKNLVKFQKYVDFNKLKENVAVDGSDNSDQFAFPSIYAAATIASSFPFIFGEREDILCLVTNGIDSDPFFKMIGDICDELKLPKSVCLYSLFLPSVLGCDQRISQSNPNSTIYLTDSSKVISDKIMKHAFSGGGKTQQEHEKNGANLEVDIPFQYLRFFLDQDVEFDQIQAQYGSGKMGTGEVKQRLVEVITKIIAEYQERRKKVTDDEVKEFMRIRQLEFKMNQ